MKINCLLVFKDKSIEREIANYFKDKPGITISISSSYIPGFDFYILEQDTVWNWLNNCLYISNKIVDRSVYTLRTPINMNVLEAVLTILFHDRTMIVSKLLKGLGINSGLVGFKYILQGIEFIIKDHITNLKDLYIKIANHSNTSYLSVERAIRYAISNGWINASSQLVDEIFINSISYYKDYPSNKEFLYSISNYIFNS